MAPLPDVEPALERLARTLVALQEVQADSAAAARRLSAAPGSPTALRAMARAELRERRARLHVELARAALARTRAAALDEQRRVPAAFRRRPAGSAPAVEVLGSALQTRAGSRISPGAA